MGNGPKNLSRHYYAHLDAYAPNIQTGDWVEVGEVLGYVGEHGQCQEYATTFALS